MTFDRRDNPWWVHVEVGELVAENHRSRPVRIGGRWATIAPRPGSVTVYKTPHIDRLIFRRTRIRSAP